MRPSLVTLFLLVLTMIPLEVFHIQKFSTTFTPSTVLIYHMCVLSHFSCVQLLETLWTAVRQAPLSVDFSRQEYWSGLPCPPPRDFPDPGIEPMPPAAPALQADALPLSHWGTHTNISRIRKVNDFSCMPPSISGHLCVLLHAKHPDT